MEQSLWLIHSPGMNEIGLVGLGYYYSQPLIQLLHHLKSIVSWVDPDGGGGGGGQGVPTPPPPPPPPPLENHKNIGALAMLVRSQSYQASIQFWAI